MGQKVHPVGIRLGNTRRSHSCWYRPKSYYSFFLNEDRYIREFIFRITCKKKPENKVSAIVSKIQIDRGENSSV